MNEQTNELMANERTGKCMNGYMGKRVLILPKPLNYLGMIRFQ